MANARSELRLVDPDTGEIHVPPDVRKYEDTIVGLQSTIRSQAASMGNLKRELNLALSEVDTNHDAFPAFKRCFDFWKERCKHPNTEYELADFKLFEPLHRKHGEDKCRRAIEGAAYDCYVSTRKNGSPHYHNEWELIFRNGTKFREFVNKAPYHKPKPEHLSIICKALIWQHPDWKDERVMAEAKTRVRRWAI